MLGRLLDCLASNGRLRRYYEDQGFIYQCEVTDRDYVAALYERIDQRVSSAVG